MLTVSTSCPQRSIYECITVLVLLVLLLYSQRLMRVQEVPWRCTVPNAVAGLYGSYGTGHAQHASSVDADAHTSMIHIAQSALVHALRPDRVVMGVRVWSSICLMIAYKGCLTCTPLHPLLPCANMSSSLYCARTIRTRVISASPHAHHLPQTHQQNC